MLRKLKTVLSIILLSIIFISSSSTLIQAAYNISEAYIVKIGQADYHLKYFNESKGMYTYVICNIVGHYENGNFYPAYCLNKNAKGAESNNSYSVDVDSLINNDKVWRTVKNGYPYKSAEQMGLSSDFDAFTVTKMAVYCVTGESDINLFKAEENDETAKAMLNALYKLVDIGLHGEESYKENLKAEKISDFIEDGDYYSVSYKVSSFAEISGYQIIEVTGLSDGDLVTDVNGNIKTSFSSGEIFKIKISKNNLNSDKNINIKFKASLKNYPMFYGKTRIANTQNYLLTASSYQDIYADVSLNLKLNNGKIIINKIDSQTKQGIKDVEFNLYDSNDKMLGTYTTNDEGKIEINNLYQGVYTLKETKANENYILNQDSIYTINVNYNKTSNINIENEHKKGNLTIYKVDKDDNNISLGNVEFELYNVELDKLVGVYNTDVNGKIEIKNLRTGDYKLKETKANEWYNLADDTNIKVLWNETAYTKVEDELKKSQIRIIKVDKDNNDIKLEGVKFEVLDQFNNCLEILTTDCNGEAITKQYPIRDYKALKIHEIETNDNYKLNNEITEVTLEENKTKDVILENEKKKGQIEVIKVDKDNNEVKLKGVEFNVLDISNNIVETLVTNEEGKALTKLLPIDKEYKVQEIKTLENYVLGEETKTVTLQENQITSLTFVNEKKKGQIEVIKVDKDNNEVKLKGVSFNVLDSLGNVVDCIITGDDGVALTKPLPIDEIYTLQETKTLDNYVLSDEIKKVVLQENQISSITFENEKIKGIIKVKKTTADDSNYSGLLKGEALEGVIFEVYDENSKLVDIITTNQEGIATTKKLEKGIYKIKEVSTNEWYILDDTYYKAEILKNNQEVILNVTNIPGAPEENVEKTGPDFVSKNEEIEYLINVQNEGNVKLDNFTLEDVIPTDYIRVTKIELGNYNQDNKYNVYYKTNLSEDYILLLEDVSTKTSETIDLNSELAENEYITNIKLDFNTVDVGFKNENNIKLYAKVNSNVKRDEIFENKVYLKSNYNTYNLVKESSSKSKIYEILPITGC